MRRKPRKSKEIEKERKNHEFKKSKKKRKLKKEKEMTLQTDTARETTQRRKKLTHFDIHFY